MREKKKKKKITKDNNSAFQIWCLKMLVKSISLWVYYTLNCKTVIIKKAWLLMISGINRAHMNVGLQIVTNFHHSSHKATRLYLLWTLLKNSHLHCIIIWTLKNTLSHWPKVCIVCWPFKLSHCRKTFWFFLL